MNKRYACWPCRSSLWVEGIVIAVCWQPYYSKGCTRGNVRPQVGHYYPSVGWTSLTSPVCSIVHIYHGSVGRKYCQDEIIILCCPEKECQARSLMSEEAQCAFKPKEVVRSPYSNSGVKGYHSKVWPMKSQYFGNFTAPSDAKPVLFVCNWTLHSKATASNDN